MAFRQLGPCPRALIVTDGVSIVALTVCPPWTAISPPFPAPPTFFPGTPLTGLECHGPFIIATDQDGYSYVVTDPSCFSPLPPIVIPPRPPLAVNVHGVNNVIGNVFDRGNFDLWVTDGTNLVRTLGPIGAIVLAPPALTIPRGSSFSAEPVALKACGINYSNYKITTNQPIVIGKTVEVGLNCPAALAGAPAALVLGNCVPGGTLLDCSFSCLFWLDNFNGIAFGNLDPNGDLCVSLTIPALWGASGYLQWAFFDPTCFVSHPLVSDALYCRISYE
jgi:hypothetical protein